MAEMLPWATYSTGVNRTHSLHQAQHMSALLAKQLGHVSEHRILKPSQDTCLDLHCRVRSTSFASASTSSVGPGPSAHHIPIQCHEPLPCMCFLLTAGRRSAASAPTSLCICRYRRPLTLVFT